MSWPVVLASGGPCERGRMYGEQAAARIAGTISMYEEIFSHYTGLSWVQVRSRAGAFIDAIDAYDVQLLPELEGMAEGAGVEPEDLLAVNLRTEIMFGLDARPGRAEVRAAVRECTAIACARDDGVVVAQNWDWKPGARNTCVLLVCAPHDSPGFVTLVEAGLWAKCGANEAGLGLVTNALQSSLDRGEPGVPYHAILRRILTSATFEQAGAAVRGAARASSANYLIASRDGRLLDIEAAPGGPIAIHETSGGALCHTNHFLWESPRPFKDLGLLEGEESLLRQARAEEAVMSGPTPLTEVWAVLSTHADGDGSVCAHEDTSIPEVEDYVTVGTLVADLTAVTISITEGNPCRSQPDIFPLTDLVSAARSRASYKG